MTIDDVDRTSREMRKSRGFHFMRSHARWGGIDVIIRRLTIQAEMFSSREFKKKRKKIALIDANENVPTREVHV